MVEFTQCTAPLLECRGANRLSGRVRDVNSQVHTMLKSGHKSHGIQMAGSKKGNTGNQHVVPVDGKWGVQGVGNSRKTVVVDTQREAIDRAREIAQNRGTEVVIHRPNGQIRDKDSYGNDPFPPKG